METVWLTTNARVRIALAYCVSTLESQVFRVERTPQDATACGWRERSTSLAFPDRARFFKKLSDSLLARDIAVNKALRSRECDGAGCRGLVHRLQSRETLSCVGLSNRREFGRSPTHVGLRELGLLGVGQIEGKESHLRT
jgi:hypothetical protein